MVNINELFHLYIWKENNNKCNPVNKTAILTIEIFQPKAILNSKTLVFGASLHYFFLIVLHLGFNKPFLIERWR